MVMEPQKVEEFMIDTIQNIQQGRSEQIQLQFVNLCRRVMA